jgi:hypothetical protein
MAVPHRGRALAALEPDPAKRVGSVFRQKNGEDWGQIRTAFEMAVERAGLSDFRFHDLRHTAASHLAMPRASAESDSGSPGAQELQHDVTLCPPEPNAPADGTGFTCGLTPAPVGEESWTHSIESETEPKVLTPQVLDSKRLRP